MSRTRFNRVKSAFGRESMISTGTTVPGAKLNTRTARVTPLLIINSLSFPTVTSILGSDQWPLEPSSFFFLWSLFPCGLFLAAHQCVEARLIEVVVRRQRVPDSTVFHHDKGHAIGKAPLLVITVRK